MDVSAPERQPTVRVIDRIRNAIDNFPQGTDLLWTIAAFGGGFLFGILASL